jgi:DtxR family Mn-dependent transcriptional regulator
VAGYETPEWHPAFEEYCETIFELGEDDVVVKQARIAERLGVSRPAVSEMVHRMQAEGLVVAQSGTVKLSASGKRFAERVVRRHRVAERFLTDILGISSPEAHHEAGKWEHVISDPVEAAMLKLLGDPTTCPHGNPIPGTGYKAPTTRPLAELATGTTFTVSRIPEELEFAPGLLEFLDESRIAPGADGKVTASSPDGTTTIEVAGIRVGVGSFASQRILTTTRD